MLTLEQAKNLRPGVILLDEGGKRWKVNGQPQTWVRSPERVRVPLKHGLYAYGQLLETDLAHYMYESAIEPTDTPVCTCWLGAAPRHGGGTTTEVAKFDPDCPVHGSNA
jgi:hypothetical protein